MKIVAVIQARSNSSRFPGKVLQPFSNGMNTIDHAISTLRAAGLEHIVIATTDLPSDDALFSAYHLVNNISVYRGSEENVLSRFIEIIKMHQPDYIVRVCADNPFLFQEGIMFLIKQLENNQNDAYLSFKIWEKPAMKVPLGIFVEMFKSSRLMQIAESPTSLDKEHVTISLYNENLTKHFKLYDFADEFFNISQEIRLTVDTPEDFLTIDLIIKKLNITGPIDRMLLNKILKFIEDHQLYHQMHMENSKLINSKNYTLEATK